MGAAEGGTAPAGGVGAAGTAVPGARDAGKGAHPVAIRVAAARQAIIERCGMRIAAPAMAARVGLIMWVIYLEAAVAVTLVLFIVWWTMGGKK